MIDNFHGSQIIIGALIVFIMIKTIMSYRLKRISLMFFIIWAMFWLVMFFFLFYQNLLMNLAGWLNIGRGTDLAVYISIIVIFYIIFRIYEALIDINKRITKLVRKIAIREGKRGEKN